MRKKLFLIGIVMILALNACSLPRLVKNDPTATPKPSQPTSLPTRQVEPTAVVPTTAPTDAPTETPQTVDQPVIPADLEGTVSVGRNLLSETFDESGLWNTSEDPEFGADVTNGVYRMYLNSENWMVWAESTRVTGANVIMDLDTNLVSGSLQNNQGMVCRYVDDENFYMLTVGNDGWVEIMKFIQGQQTSLFGEFIDALIDPVNNHLQGFCIGDRLALYVNGKLGADVRDNDLVSGDVGLIIGSYDEPQVTIDFDNFMVYEAIGNFTTVTTPEPVEEGVVLPDVANDWNLNFSDDFDAPNNGKWMVFFGDTVVSERRNGRFAFDFNETLRSATSVTNELDLEDVIVKVEVYRVGDVLENDMGLVCRYQDEDNYYSVSFGNDDYMTIYKTIAGTWTALFNEFGDTDLSGDYHSLAISCIGTEISLYIDEQLMARVNDSDLATGDVGLISGSYDSVPVVLEFDNFLVYTPK